MSDTSQGEGWWQASDGKWYAPELHPDYVAPAPEPPIQPPIVTAATPLPAEPGGGGWSRGKVIAIAVVILALIAAGTAFALTRDNDDNATTASNDSSSSSSSASSASSSSSSSTKSSESVDDLLARAKRALITGPEIARGFEKASPTAEEGSFPCDGQTYDKVVKPAGASDVEFDRGDELAVVERIRVYKNEVDASKAFDAANGGYDCGHGTVTTGSGGSFPVTVVNRPAPFGARATDGNFTSSLEFHPTAQSNGAPQNLQPTTAPPSSDAETSTTVATPAVFNENAYVARVGQTVIVLEFYATPDADVTNVPTSTTLAKAAIAKFTR